MIFAGAIGAGGALYYYLGGRSDLSDSSKNASKNPPPPTGGPSTSGAPPSTAEQHTVPKDAAFQGGDQGFLSLKLESVEQTSHNTKRFKFLLPDPENVSGLPITSAVITKYKGPEDHKPTIRPYTPVNAEDEKGVLEFVIKKYPGGPMSTHLHDMEPGQRLDIKGPIPKYPWTPNKHPSIALIAGGTGITP